LEQTATDWHDGQNLQMCHAHCGITTLVIPGRRASVEPGIHLTAEHVAQWIPGPRFARPGMTERAALGIAASHPNVTSRPTRDYQRLNVI
jgi:hypothetical protein